VTSTNARPQQEGLRRELGKWDLTAVGVNQVIGGAIFALAAGLAANTGSWAPWLVAAVALASLLIALSFAEVGSRFDGTGGPYLYTRAAFGRFPAFEVGWMMWFTRAASWASVINVLVDALGRYWPLLLGPAARPLLLAGIIGLIAWINTRGIRQSSLVVNVLTVAKVLPLVVFVLVGIAYVDWGSFGAPATMTGRQLSTGALILIFAFGGYEVIPVLGGETQDPRRAIPFALIMTIAIVAAITLLTQVVAFGTLPGIAQSKTPLADSAAMFMGAAGAVMITLGAVLSTSGNNMGQALSGSRNLFALAEQGDLPRWFGTVHPRFRTPAFAVAAGAAWAIILAVTGTFEQLLTYVVFSGWIFYGLGAMSIFVYRRRDPGAVRPFRVPGYPLTPALFVAASAAIVLNTLATQPQRALIGLAVVVAGAPAYVLWRRAAR